MPVAAYTRTHPGADINQGLSLRVLMPVIGVGNGMTRDSMVAGTDTRNSKESSATPPHALSSATSA